MEESLEELVERIRKENPDLSQDEIKQLTKKELIEKVFRENINTEVQRVQDLQKLRRFLLSEVQGEDTSKTWINESISVIDDASTKMRIGYGQLESGLSDELDKLNDANDTAKNILKDVRRFDSSE
ncbi:MAG: hypothetical protein SVY15_04700 [Halobacteriota archaeon]|nr:hypothetical protein [Halobacteriota archaeon]